MGVLLKKREGFALSGIAKLSLIGLVVSFSAAFINTIWAVYIDSFVNSTVIVGFISAFLTFVSFISYFIFIPLIEKNDKAKIFLYSLILFIPIYILFAVNKNFYLFLVLSLIMTVLYTFRITSFGIIVKGKSKKSELIGNHGILYTFINISWVVGPLIAGYIASIFGVSYVFIFSALILFFCFFIFRFVRIKDGHVKKNLDTGILRNFFDFFRDRDRVFAYLLGGGVVMWFILIYLFMPLFIIRSGLGDLAVGYFLFLISVPLILSEYKLSKLTEKYGFKKMFILGFLVISIISIICFFITDIYLILFLLILASFGVAMLEPTTEAYFFNILRNSGASRFYGPYNTRIDSFGLIARILASLILIFLPFKFLFILFGIFMLVMVFFAIKIKDVH